jgi:hypothetical protein
VDYVAVLLPSLVVGLLFWFAMKSIFNADKSERQAEARAQAEADARAAAGAAGHAAGPTSAGPASAGPRPGPATDAPSEPTAESDK